MLREIITSLHLYKIEALFQKGIEDGRIVSFDDEFYNLLKETYISGLPVSIHIKHLKPKVSPGKCYERSLYMFLSLKDSILVRGDVKDLEYRFGKEKAGHGWIEIGNYVYDPSHLKRFDKDLYYEMYKPTKIKKCTHKEYMKRNKEFYNNIINTTLDDFRSNTQKRLDLITIIPVIEATAKLPGNTELLKDLNEFLKAVEYNEKEIFEELNRQVTQLIKQENHSLI